jgi:Domain of unknown function (DUF4114)
MSRFKVCARLAPGLLALALAAPVHAGPGVPIAFGTSWDGADKNLQAIVDATFGTGKYATTTAYIGAQSFDPDPFFWVDQSFSALVIREIAGNANRNVVGWYLEPDDGSKPVIDGVDDGVIFDGPAGPGATAVIVLGSASRRFGFYMNPNGPGGATNAPEPEVFFTNRMYNDRGPTGGGAIHVPMDGDVQALIIDVSTLSTPNTWLVCFEDLDSGGVVGTECDNDFNDFVFEVTAVSVTPTAPLSFGALKRRYR